MLKSVENHGNSPHAEGKKAVEKRLKTKKETEIEVSIEKKFFLALSEVTDILSPVQVRKISRAHKRRDVPDKILRGQSFPERDYTIRSLAAKAYNIAQLMEKNSDYERQLKWMKLVARLFSLSLEPKKLTDLEEIKKALAEIKRQREAMK